MSDSSQPHNRKTRRAAAREAAKKGEHVDPSTGIKFIQPDFDSKPKGKTLMEIAEEKRALLEQGQPFTKQGDETPVLDKDGDFEFMSDEPLPAFANAIIYCISLSMLHFTLDVLVLSQYRQDVVWSEIAGRLTRMTPALLLVIWFFHIPQVKRFRVARQLVFLVASIAAGCYLIYTGNTYGYYHVMKNAPPVGTLWVWSVVEMELLYAVAHCVAVVGYMWWNGFGNF